MAKTANDLIISAFYLTNEYSPDEMPSGDEILEGLYYLNELKDSMSENNSYVTHIKPFAFQMNAGQSEYSFGKGLLNTHQTQRIIEIFDSYIVFNSIQYPVFPVQHDQMWMLPRSLTTQTRPTWYHLQKYNDRSVMKFLYTPDLAYDIVLRAKFFIDDFALQTDITNFPNSTLRYLRYRLAKELCQIFETNTWNNIKEAELQQMEKEAVSYADVDHSLQQTNSMRPSSLGLGKIYLSAP